jgi:hypothetical protein
MPAAKMNNPKTHHGALKLFSEGGTMDKKMEMRHAMAMKKAGVPKKMVAEEMSEAMKMKCGRKVQKYARGGGIEIKGKTRGRMC